MTQEVQPHKLQTQRKALSFDIAKDLRHPEEDSLVAFLIYVFEGGTAVCLKIVVFQLSQTKKILQEAIKPHIIFGAFWEVLRYKV